MTPQSGNRLKCNFSFKHYQEILELFKERGYKFCFFSENPDLKSKKIYLRHDIEISLNKALQLAQIENQNKVYSTYFVQVSNFLYNPFNKRHAEIIRKINGLGHQIGLHFWDDYDRLNEKEISKEVARQLQVLRAYFNVKNVVSFHRPTDKLFNKKFNSFISTYEIKFFKKIKYLSESNAIWREGCVCKWLNDAHCPSNLQLLIHPLWWGKGEKDQNKHLYNLFRKGIKRLDESLANNFKIYKKKFSLIKFYEEKTK